MVSRQYPLEISVQRVYAMEFCFPLLSHVPLRPNSSVVKRWSWSTNAQGARSANTRSRVPVTKLGRLVKDGKIKSMEEIYLFSLPVKEYQIIDMFLPTLKDEVMSIAPVQKQTSAGQRTRFKAFVAVGDFDG